MAQLQVGDRVTVRAPVEPYYSGYGGNPRMTVTPGMVGIVQSVGNPSVYREGVTFDCVDFDIAGRVWRVGERPEVFIKVG